MMDARNVVLVIWDSARSDVFAREAVNLASFGSTGLTFTRAIAPAGWTLPSHASMYSGLAPTEHGVTALGEGRRDRPEIRKRVGDLAESRGLVAMRLAEAGIDTFCSSANPWLGPASGLHAGFEETDFFGFLGEARMRRAASRREPGRLDRAVGIARASVRHAAWIRSGRDKGAERVLQGMARFWRAQTGPSFVVTNLIETHEPHVSPVAEPGRRTRRGLEAVNAILQPGDLRWWRITRHNWGRRGLPRRLLERWRQAYAAEVRYVDGWLLRLAEELDAARRLDDTVVIATGDHGENFGEGGIVGHGLSPREETARVPLAIWGAGIEPRVVRRPVSLRAIAETVEEIALGRELPGSLLRAEPEGTPSIELEDPRLVSRPPAGARRTARGPGAAFYDGDMKLVFDPFSGPALYDLSGDPAETEDLLAREQPGHTLQTAAKQWGERAGVKTSW